MRRGVSAGKYINNSMDAESKFKQSPPIMDFFTKLISDKESLVELQNFGIGIIALTFACIVFYVAFNDPKSMTENFHIYIILAILPVVFGIIIASKIFSGELDANKYMFYGTTIIVFIISVFMYYQVLNPAFVSYFSYILIGLVTLGFIVGLAIVYRIFVRTVLNTRGWLGFFLKFMFLIPCLLINGLETLFSELKSAPKMVLVLFILELIIVLAYLYIYRLRPTSTSSITLLNRPEFLSTVKTIGKANQLVMDVNDVNNPSKDLNMIRQNYSISMWFQVNQHPNTHAAYSKETNIFRFGYPNSQLGHPRVAYFNNFRDPDKSDKYIVYINDSTDISGVLLDMPGQSWNQFVISYTDSTVDIFVNGNLEKSIPLESTNRPMYDMSDVLEIGEGDNTVTNGGLHGAICNVVYHKTPLKPYQVATDYNLNRYKNPPVTY
jgi:hypothetical protein